MNGESELQEFIDEYTRMLEEDTITVPKFKYMMLGSFVEAAKAEVRRKDELISRMQMVLREIIIASDDLNGVDDNASFAYHMRHSHLKVGDIRKIAEMARKEGLWHTDDM